MSAATREHRIAEVEVECGATFPLLLSVQRCPTCRIGYAIPTARTEAPHQMHRCPNGHGVLH